MSMNRAGGLRATQGGSVRNHRAAREGLCIFCQHWCGVRKRSTVLLKHLIWVTGGFEVCPGSGSVAMSFHPAVADAPEADK